MLMRARARARRRRNTSPWPVGLGVYKTHLFGKMPIKFGVETQYYAIRPDNLSEEFNIRVVIAPMIPALF